MFPRTQPARLPVSLHRLFPRASFVGCADIRVDDATERSSDVAPNTLFAAVPGTKVDGHQFVAEAVARGASALLVQRPFADVDLPQCIVPNVRRGFAELSSALYGCPSRRLKTAGVTGTNGKTTTTFLIRSILRAANRSAGLLGTVEYSDGIEHRTSQLTTPDARTLAGWLASMVARHTTHAAMELSSHALDQDRAAGVSLDVAVVTNITQDHFDYHGDFDNYRACKRRIFDLLKRGGLAVLNADDRGSASLKESIGSHGIKTFGLEKSADVMAEIIHESTEGTRFVLRMNGQETDVFTPLVGRHNVSNCLAAATAAHHLGASLFDIAAGIDNLEAVPGRLERVDVNQPFDCFVDYAHTDDALRRCVRFLKSLTRGRLICVFGAGGDRDRTKRPLLGKAAAEADLSVVTSDNPRTEKPEAIINEIVEGFRGTNKQPFIEVDRAAAIRWALQHAGPGDCVLIAGKGHETEQIIGTQRLPFDDRQVARAMLQEIVGSKDRRPARQTA